MHKDGSGGRYIVAWLTFLGLILEKGGRPFSPYSTNSKLNVARLLCVDSKVPPKPAAAVTDFIKVIFLGHSSDYL